MTQNLKLVEKGLFIEKLSKQYKKRQVLTDVSLHVKRGEAVALLGPNGAGKTTCFYMISGLIQPDAGKIILDGTNITELPMYRRAQLGIGYLPQENSIFRGLTVEENIKAVVEGLNLTRHEAKDRVDSLLDEFKLSHLRQSPALALSGGERRRVEIARALSTAPSFILLDEPFSNLDEFLKDDVISEVFPIFKENGIAVIFVSHNIEEAFSVSDKTMVLAHGRVQQLDNPFQIYERPANVFVARFTGKINLLASNILDVTTEKVKLKNIFGEFEAANTTWLEGKKFVYLAIRPEEVILSNEDNSIAGKIKRIEYRGSTQLLYIQALDKNKFLITRPGREKYQIDQRVRFVINEQSSFLLPI